MSSSPTTAHLPAALADTCGSRLLDLLNTVPDPRARRGRRHGLAFILALGLAAVIGGAGSFVAIGEWAAHQPIETLRILGVTGPTVLTSRPSVGCSPASMPASSTNSSAR
jgi:hypothetical protein